MKVLVKCKVCGKEEMVSKSRSERYVTCSKSCLGKYKKKIPNKICKQCGTPIYVKPSRKSSKMGNFCSIKCLAEYQKLAFLGNKNPNYKGITRDQDDYVMENIPNIGNIKLHKYVVLKTLNIDKIPNGLHIHHRDCNKFNNLPSNLVLLSISDHRWLHWQFGTATLWGYCNNKISKKILLECSNDQNRSNKLLDLSIEDQIGNFNTKKINKNIKTI